MKVVKLSYPNYEYDVHSLVKAFYAEEQVTVITPETKPEKLAELEPQDTHSSEITYAIIIYLLVNVHVLVHSEPYRYFNTFARNIQVKSLYFFLLSLAKNKERDYNEKYL